MNYGAEPADQVVRYSLEGMEYSLKITGNVAKHVAVFIAAALKDQKKTRGKTRLTRMLKEQRPMKFFTVPGDRLKEFAKEAKARGILYVVIKDKVNPDQTEVMVFAEFLEGAAEEDKLAKNEDVMQNPAMLDALIGVYERNILGYPSTAVLPYSQALSRFPAHLQQLDMESNGKSVNRFGEPVDYVTGPVIFGEPGTNGQHSFYQLLHQGTDIVPLQFIGFKNNQMGTDVVIQDSTSQQKLCANVAAQIVAFACGKADDNRNKNFEGGRPSSIIIGDQVNPASLGALLAHFENKVMFQGFLWNVNSFDQEGVQLGKVLAKRVLAHETDGALKVFSDLLNI